MLTHLEELRLDCPAIAETVEEIEEAIRVCTGNCFDCDPVTALMCLQDMD